MFVYVYSCILEYNNGSGTVCGLAIVVGITFTGSAGLTTRVAETILSAFALSASSSIAD